MVGQGGAVGLAVDLHSHRRVQDALRATRDVQVAHEHVIQPPAGPGHHARAQAVVGERGSAVARVGLAEPGALEAPKQGRAWRGVEIPQQHRGAAVP